MSRYYTIRFVILTLFFVTLLFIPFHLKPDNFIVDDGYFYPQIARNIALGYGSTFNRVMPTNGYHPLWMLCCILGAFITKSSSHLIQVLAVMQDLLILLSVYLLIYICAITKKLGAIAGVVIIAFLTETLGITRMLEADLSLAIQLIIFVVTLKYSIQSKDIKPWHAFIGGILLGLTLLARLDLIFLVSIVYAYWILNIYGGKSQLKLKAINISLISAGTCITICPYLYWNYHYFRHIEPISGAIKSTFPHFQLPLHFPFFSYPVIIACVFNFAFFFYEKKCRFTIIALIASVGALLHLIFSVLFGSLAPWYLTTGYLCVALCSIWIFDKILRASKYPVKVMVYASTAIFTVILSLEVLRLVSNFTYTRFVNRDVSFKRGYIEPKRALAEQLRKMLPQDARIYAYDAPGGMAFYSGMSIIPVDGLVNDYAYNRILLSKGISNYMADNQINYIIAPMLQAGQKYDNGFLTTTWERNGQVFNIIAPLYHRSAGTFFVSDNDILSKFQTVNPNFEKQFPYVAIWRIHH